MRLVLLALMSVVVLSQVESGKIKICLPKKKKHLTVADLSFDETFKTITKFPDEVKLDFTVPFKMDNEVIRATGYASNITISNFLNFTICIFQKLTEPMNVTLNTLTIRAEEYNITGEVGDLFDIYGNGTFEMNIDRFSFAINHLSLKWPLGCFGVDLNVAMQGLKANFPNLMYGDPLLTPLFNKVLGDLAPDSIDFVWSRIYDSLADIINQFLDKYVNHLELENFVEVYTEGVKKNLPKGKCYDFPKRP